MKKNRFSELRRQRNSFASYMGGDEENPLAMHSNYSGPVGMMTGGGGIQQVTGVGQELNITLQNTDTANALAVRIGNFNAALTDAFDGGLDPTGTAAGAGVGIVTEINNETHETFKRRNIHLPLFIEGIRVIFPTSTQLAQKWTLITRSNNQLQEATYTPANKLTAGQQQANQIDDRNFKFIFTPDSGIQLLLEAAPGAGTPTLVQIYMNVRAQTDIAENLKGKAAMGYHQGNSLGGNNLY